MAMKLGKIDPSPIWLTWPEDEDVKALIGPLNPELGRKAMRKFTDLPHESDQVINQSIEVLGGCWFGIEGIVDEDDVPLPRTADDGFASDIVRKIALTLPTIATWVLLRAGELYRERHTVQEKAQEAAAKN